MTAKYKAMLTPCDRTAVCLRILLLALLVSVSIAATRDAQIALFDGSSLAGWTGLQNGDWRVAEGELTVAEDAGDTMLVSTERFSNFILLLEFYVEPEVNSGVFIPCSDAEKISPVNCYELNIWDDHPRQEFRSGSIVLHTPPLVHVETVGQWNQMKVVATDKRVTLEINGEITADIESAEHTAGFIALQRFGSGSVRFRNILIRPL